MTVDAGSKRSLVTWVGLVAITLGYAALDGSARASAVVTSTAIVVALVKVRIIFREFMEVRHAPALLGLLTDLCVALMAAVMLGSYFISRAVH